MVANDFEVISKSVCVFSFIGIIVLLALKFLFKGDKDDSLKKVIGGLGVFTVAIVSNNSYIYVLALFIGGLLIASERFLLFLASIFKAESRDISGIASKFESLTEKQIDEKREKEIQTLRSFKGATVYNQKGVAVRLQPIPDGKEMVKKYENELLAKIKGILIYSGAGLAVREYVAVKDGERNKQYDAIIVARNTDIIKVAFEIKFLGEMSLQKTENYFSDDIKNIVSEKYKTIFMIVFTNYDYNIAQELLRFRENQLQKHLEYAIAYFYIKDNRLVSLNDEDVERLRKELDPFEIFN